MTHPVTKEELEQKELQPTFDDIDDLERQVKFYKDRVNQLQCWQSSMRDPERKIVCDILANGFTLTTKEEVSRPDPLALLQKWRNKNILNPLNMDAEDWYYLCDQESDFIELLRTNPSAVREQGIEQGWWHDE